MIKDQIHEDILSYGLLNAALESWAEDKNIFVPIIERWAGALRDYDALRPAGHPYPFDEHALRVATEVQGFAAFLGADRDRATILYWATLPHDIGKTALPVSIWDSKDKPSQEEKEQRRQHVEKGLDILDQAARQLNANDHPFIKLTRRIMENHHEALDGSGLFKKTAPELDLIDRISCICDSFDGWSVKRPHFGDRDISPHGVITRMEDEKAGQFDPDLLTLFKRYKGC
jgi:putative two-component system response regulator